MGARDPSFATPLIKSLLKKRNRLRRCGNFEAANQLADNINRLITDFRRKQSFKLANSDPKNLWVAVNGKCRHSDLAKRSSLLSSPDFVDQFYATVATADDYCQDEIVSMREVLTPGDYYT